jgi:hypothetical protein
MKCEFVSENGWIVTLLVVLSSTIAILGTISLLRLAASLLLWIIR